MPKVKVWQSVKGFLRSRDYDAIKALLEAASYFCGIITLGVIAYQLRSDADDRRVTKSLDMIARYGTEPLSSQRMILRDFELVNKEGYDAIRRAGGLSTENAQIWIEGQIPTYNRDNPDKKIELAIREIAGFFDEVATCKSQGICDENTIEEFLASEANDLRCTFGSVIAGQRKTYNRLGLGQGLDKISGGLKCTKPTQ